MFLISKTSGDDAPGPLQYLLPSAVGSPLHTSKLRSAVPDFWMLKSCYSELWTLSNLSIIQRFLYSFQNSTPKLEEKFDVI